MWFWIRPNTAKLFLSSRFFSGPNGNRNSPNGKRNSLWRKFSFLRDSRVNPGKGFFTARCGYDGHPDLCPCDGLGLMERSHPYRSNTSFKLSEKRPTYLAIMADRYDIQVDEFTQSMNEFSENATHPLSTIQKLVSGTGQVFTVTNAIIGTSSDLLGEAPFLRLEEMLQERRPRQACWNTGAIGMAEPGIVTKLPWR